MLRKLVSERQLQPVSATGFALTPALRESYVSGSTEELEYAALLDAARASLRLLADDQKEPARRVVVSVDVDNATARPDLDAAVVRLAGPIVLDEVAAVHVDTEAAE